MRILVTERCWTIHDAFYRTRLKLTLPESRKGRRRPSRQQSGWPTKTFCVEWGSLYRLGLRRVTTRGESRTHSNNRRGVFTVVDVKVSGTTRKDPIRGRVLPLYVSEVLVSQVSLCSKRQRESVFCNWQKLTGDLLPRDVPFQISDGT